MRNVFSNIICRRKEWILILPLLILYSGSYFQRTAVPGMIFDQLAGEIGAEYVPGLGPAFIWIYSLSQLVIGVWIDRYSARKVVSLGGMIFCIGVLMLPFMSNPWLMYLSRMAAGLGAGTMYLSLVRECDRLFGHANYSIMMGVVYVTGYAGGLIGTMPFGRLVEIYSWHDVLLGAAVISCLSYAWFMIAYRNEDKPAVCTVRTSAPETSAWKELKGLLKNRLMWTATFCGTVNFAVYFTIQTVFGKKMLCDINVMSAVEAEFAIFVMTFVCIGALFSGSVLTRLIGNRRRPLMLFASVVEVVAVAIMVLALWKGLPAFCYVVSMVLFAVSSGMLIIYSMTAQEAGKASTLTQCAGLCNMLNYLGAVFLTLAAGWWLSRFAMSGKDGVVYPLSAYLQMFVVLLITAVISLLLVFTLPETNGKFLADKK